MTTLVTNYLERINCTLVKFASKRSGFPLTHWARAEIAIMNRISECGSLGTANRNRRNVGLETLSDYAGSKVERRDKRDRRDKGVTMNQFCKTPEKK